MNRLKRKRQLLKRGQSTIWPAGSMLSDTDSPLKRGVDWRSHCICLSVSPSMDRLSNPLDAVVMLLLPPRRRHERWEVLSGPEKLMNDFMDPTREAYFLCSMTSRMWGEDIENRNAHDLRFIYRCRNKTQETRSSSTAKCSYSSCPHW